MKKKKLAKVVLLLAALATLASCSSGKGSGKNCGGDDGVCHIGDKK